MSFTEGKVTFDACGLPRESPEQIQKAFGIRRSLMLLSDPNLFEPKWLAECVELGLPKFKEAA